MMIWTRQQHLPDEEPNKHNADAYAAPQLLAGASEDGQYIYDAVYVASAGCFLLTALKLNTEWGFIEQERRCKPVTRQALLAETALLEHDPEHWLAQSGKNE